MQIIIPKQNDLLIESMHKSIKRLYPKKIDYCVHNVCFFGDYYAKTTNIIDYSVIKNDFILKMTAIFGLYLPTK